MRDPQISECRYLGLTNVGSTDSRIQSAVSISAPVL